MKKRFYDRIKGIRKRWIALAVAAIAVGLLVTSRSPKDEHTVAMDIDPETTPTMMTTRAMSLVSDSGYVRYKIEALVWEIFDAAQEPNWKFRQGLYVEQYDDSMKVAGTFVCDSAIYRTVPKLWEFIGNVRVRNVAGDRFVTQLLFWNERERKIYSDSFIHIEKSDRIIEGYGFESDDRIEDYIVHHPTMIVPVSDFNRERNDSVTEPQETAQSQSGDVAGEDRRPGRPVQQIDRTRRQVMKQMPRQMKTDKRTGN